MLARRGAVTSEYSVLSDNLVLVLSLSSPSLTSRHSIVKMASASACLSQGWADWSEDLDGLLEVLADFERSLSDWRDRERS